MMKNYWKRFAAWGIGFGASFPDVFASVRFRITALYFLTSVVVLLLVGSFADGYIATLVRREIERLAGDPQGASSAAMEVAQKMQILLWLVWGAMVFGMGFAAYIIAGFTLRPIRRSVDTQRRFVANASHELRTPLAIMKTNSDVALTGEITKEEAREVIRSNAEEIDRMVEILRVLLTLSSYENRIDRLVFSETDLTEVATRGAAFLRPYAASHKVRVTVSGDASVLVHGNAAALEEMVANLVRNAISYTPREGLSLFR